MLQAIEQRLTTASIFHHWHTALFVGLFFGIRLLSFTTFNHPIIQSVLVFALLMSFAALYFKHRDYAWAIVLMEIILGGSGHMLEFFGLSIRVILIATFLALWLLESIGNEEHRSRLQTPHRIFYIIIAIIVLALTQAVHGLIADNDAKRVVQDLTPILFFILLLPCYRQFQQEKTQALFVRLLIAFVIGSALFALGVFVYYSLGPGAIHDIFYTWFRDVAAGKITDTGTGFLRVVLPEHLLATPLLLLVASLLMRNEKHANWWRVLLISLVLILVLNFSRTYFLALAVGLIVLKLRHSWYRWARVTGKTIILALVLFISSVFVASQGTSVGLELISHRFGSIATPQEEVSTATRSALLQPTLRQISDAPLLGHGLGNTVTFINPRTNQQQETSQYDWGYLELFAEYGFFGLVLFGLLALMLIYELLRKISRLSDYHDFYVGMLAGLVSLLVMTITTPALFHVLGVIYMMMVIVVASKPITLFDRILTILYRVFHSQQS